MWIHPNNQPTMDRTQQHNYVKVVAISVLVAALLALVMASLSGCVTQHKVAKYLDKHPIVGTEYCEAKHPCKDSVHESIRYVEGDPIITIHDSLVYDTVTNTVQKVVVKYVTKTLTRVDTVYNDRVVFQTDKAKETLLQAKLATATKQNATHAANAVKWRKWAIWALIALIMLVLFDAMYIYYKFKR